MFEMHESPSNVPNPYSTGAMQMYKYRGNTLIVSMPLKHSRTNVQKLPECFRSFSNVYTKAFCAKAF
jgi:hypothetical protein